MEFSQNFHIFLNYEIYRIFFLIVQKWLKKRWKTAKNGRFEKFKRNGPANGKTAGPLPVNGNGSNTDLVGTRYGNAYSKKLPDWKNLFFQPNIWYMQI